MNVGKIFSARFFLLFETLVFAGFYIFGSNGIIALMHLKTDIILLNQQTVELKKEVNNLHATLTLQKKHPFFQEKIAREQLQMARADEEIYLIN